MSKQPNVEVVCCRECGARRPVEPTSAWEPCRASDLVAAHGFVIEHIEVTFLGRCPACLTAPARDEVSEAG